MPAHPTPARSWNGSPHSATLENSNKAASGRTIESVSGALASKIKDKPARSLLEKAMLERPSPEMLFPVAAQCYINSRRLAVPGGRVRLLAPRTLWDYEQYARALSKLFHDKRLIEINSALIRCYQIFRAYGHEVDENYERVEGGIVWERPAQANKIKQEVSFLVRLKQKAGCWTAEDQEDYEPVHVDEGEIPRVPTPEEQAHWLEIAERGPEEEPERWKLIYWWSLLSIHCCIGHQETRMLRIGDLNLFSHILIVRTPSAKNKYRSRTIPMSEEAQFAAQRLLERARHLGAVAPEHALFPFRDLGTLQYLPQKCMTVSGIKKLWAEVQEQAGMQWFTPNRCRHTGITRHAEAGTPLHVCMAMAGHMSRKMQDHYIAVCDAAKQEAVLRAFPSRPVKKTAKLLKRG